MALRVIVHGSIEGLLSKQTDRSKGRYDLPASDPIIFGNGTGAGKADLAFDDERTLASNTPENLDLSGVLADAFGQTIVGAKLKAILIENPASNTTNLTIGGAASNAFQGWFGDAGDTEVLKPGDRMVRASSVGWNIAAGTGDLLKIANAAGAANTYRVTLVLASA